MFGTTVRFSKILIVSLVLFGCQTSNPSMVPSGSGLDLCNDYGSVYNCIGGNYIIGMTHQGLDFGAPSGTPVISVSHGEVHHVYSSSCPGYIIKVTTKLRGKADRGAEGPVTVLYAHTKPIGGLRRGVKVQPGQVIGHIIPLLGTKCYMSTEHVHLELRVNDMNKNHISPHPYWADGVGKVTCFREGKQVPENKIVVPLRCK